MLLCIRISRHIHIEASIVGPMLVAVVVAVVVAVAVAQQTLKMIQEQPRQSYSNALKVSWCWRKEGISLSLSLCMCVCVCQ